VVEAAAVADIVAVAVQSDLADEITVAERHDPEQRAAALGQGCLDMLAALDAACRLPAAGAMTAQ
jgi:hypothetical protein